MEENPKLKGHFKLLLEWNHDIKIDSTKNIFINNTMT